jgi:hypothetical protein
VAATAPGLAETLARDSRKATRFYARFGSTETRLRHGVPVEEADRVADLIQSGREGQAQC